MLISHRFNTGSPLGIPLSKCIYYLARILSFLSMFSFPRSQALTALTFFGLAVFAVAAPNPATVMTRVRLSY